MENAENKLTIKVTVQKSETIDKEIKLPYFSKSTSFEFFKVEGKGSYETTRVRWSLGDSYANIDNGYNFDKAVASEECTEEEFDKAFNEAQKFLFMQNQLSVENEQLKKPLIDFIEKQLKECNEQDANSIIWWARFSNVVKCDLYRLTPQDEGDTKETTETK